MGRPRKEPAERMTRYVQARMTDKQYGWLADRALLEYDGDISKAVREAVLHAEWMVGILNAADRHKALDAVIDQLHSRDRSADDIELYMDEEPADEA